MNINKKCIRYIQLLAVACIGKQIKQLYEK